MNNEPVAWMMKASEPSLHCPDYLTFDKPIRQQKISHSAIPLYTAEQFHPAKKLTDEEIEQLQAEYDIDSGLTCHSVKDFARAILRKAQEK